MEWKGSEKCDVYVHIIGELRRNDSFVRAPVIMKELEAQAAVETPASDRSIEG